MKIYDCWLHLQALGKGYWSGNHVPGPWIARAYTALHDWEAAEMLLRSHKTTRAQAHRNRAKRFCLETVDLAEIDRILVATKGKRYGYRKVTAAINKLRDTWSPEMPRINHKRVRRLMNNLRAANKIIELVEAKKC